MQWLIPCNANLYDIEKAFQKYDELEWRQSATSIEIDDVIYIYVGRPYSAIKYKCVVLETNIKEPQIDDTEFMVTGKLREQYKRYMRIRLLEVYKEEKLKLEKLQENGLTGNVQGPRRINAELLNYIMTCSDKSI